MKLLKNKSINYVEFFSFLSTDYGYILTSKNDEKGDWYSIFYYEKNNLPKVKIEIEKGYLCLQILIETRYWTLAQIYKYLHHQEIAYGNFSSTKRIKANFYKYTKKYLDEYINNAESITNEKLENFYHEFPSYTFVWG